MKESGIKEELEHNVVAPHETTINLKQKKYAVGQNHNSLEFTKGQGGFCNFHWMKILVCWTCWICMEILVCWICMEILVCWNCWIFWICVKILVCWICWICVKILVCWICMEILVCWICWSLDLCEFCFLCAHTSTISIKGPFICISIFGPTSSLFFLDSYIYYSLMQWWSGGKLLQVLLSRFPYCIFSNL